MKIRPIWLSQDDGPDAVVSEPGIDGLTLDAGALAYDALNLARCLCAECKKREREEAERQRSEQEPYREQAKRLVSLTKLKTLPKLQYITQVGLDHNLKHATRTAYLRFGTKQRINSQARQLASVGFLQSSTRPTLFEYKANGLQIFADLDSTSVLKAWERDAPALYSFRGPGCGECVLEEVQLQLSKHGILYDRHFEDPREHFHSG